MRPLSTTEAPHLQFKKDGEPQKVRALSDHIGWLHTLSNKPGAKFDITIKDGLGRVRMEKKNCGTQTEKYGELVNFPTMMGEELEVEISNLQNVDELKVFLN